MLPYLAAESLLKHRKNTPGDHTIESEQKAAIAMLGLAIGKCVTSEVYGKIARAIQKRVLQHFESLIYGFAVVITLTISYADMVTFFCGMRTSKKGNV